MKGLAIGVICCLVIAIVFALIETNAITSVSAQSANETSLQNQSSNVIPSNPKYGFIGNLTISELPSIKNGTVSSQTLVPIGKLHTFSASSPQVQSAAPNKIMSGSPLYLKAGQPKAPQAISGFDGLNRQQSRNYNPPDVQMAVGPNNIVEMVNSEMEIFSKSGIIIQSTSLDVFYTLPASDDIGDVKILYDKSSSRWFATAEDFTTGKVYLAVSSSNDPTSTWTFYWFSFNNFSDQPILGLNDDKVVISINSYDSSSFSNFLGAQYVIINKNDLLAGSANPNFQFSQVSSNVASIHPVQSLSSTSTLYMVSTTVLQNNAVILYSISGSVPSATVSTTSFSIAHLQSPPNSAQPGTSALIDTGGDPRTLDAAWYQGKLWLAFSDGCTPSGDSTSRSCIHLMKIDTASQSILQNFDYGSVGLYYFYPAIRIDGTGNLDMVFGYSSSSIFPSLAITGQATTDPINTLQQPVAIKSGSGVLTITDSFGVSRYGDYFAAATDPSNAGTVWVAGEYISSNIGTIGWSTFITSMNISSPCIIPISGDWTITSSCTLSSTSTAPANVIVQSGAVLTIPNGLQLNMDFAHYHLLVKSGGGVLIKAGGKIN